MRQVQINNKNDTSMVNTMSGHQDPASHKKSQQGKKQPNSQHGWEVNHDWRVNFGKLRPQEAIDHKRKLVNPRLQNHIVWRVSTLGLHNP